MQGRRKEIMTVEDQLAIRNLIGRVAWLQDQWTSTEEYLQNFTKDCAWKSDNGQVQSGHQGVAGRLHHALDAGIAGPGIAARHCITSLEVIPDASDADKATARSYVLMVGVNGGGPQIMAYTDYVDNVRREDGVWRIAERLSKSRQMRADMHPESSSKA
jgi:hypothetical protein